MRRAAKRVDLPRMALARGSRSTAIRQPRAGAPRAQRAVGLEARRGCPRCRSAERTWSTARAPVDVDLARLERDAPQRQPGGVAGRAAVARALRAGRRGRVAARRCRPAARGRGGRAAPVSSASALGGFGASRAARAGAGRPVLAAARAAAPGQAEQHGQRGGAPHGTNGVPGSASRVAGRRASAARRRRRPRTARRGGGRRGRRSEASSGTCSREWSVPGVVGSQPWSAVSTSRSRSGSSRSSQVADGRVDLAQRAVEALDVLAVAVDLVGLDEVGEHEAAVELVHQRRRGVDRLRVGGALVLVVDADAGEHLADLADRVGRRCRRPAAPPGRSARAAAARCPCGPPCARTRPGSPRNGRAITRPTACSPCMISRATAQAA